MQNSATYTKNVHDLDVLSTKEITHLLKKQSNICVKITNTHLQRYNATEGSNVMNHWRKWLLWPAAAFSWILPQIAVAQKQPTISVKGQVVDQDNRPLEFTVIRNSWENYTFSDEQGYYQLELPADTITNQITFESTMYKSISISLIPDKDTSIDVTMQYESQMTVGILIYPSKFDRFVKNSRIPGLYFLNFIYKRYLWR